MSKLTPAHLEALAQSAAKSLAARQANAERNKLRPRATCHPLRAEIRLGLCRTCARKEDLRQKLLPATKQALAKIVKGGGDALLGKQVRAYLQTNLAEYAVLHLEAARAASRRGDARPAEWALQSVKVAGEAIVAQPAKDVGGGGGGIKVLIGVNLGGLPPQTVTIEPEPE